MVRQDFHHSEPKLTTAPSVGYRICRFAKNVSRESVMRARPRTLSIRRRRRRWMA